MGDNQKTGGAAERWPDGASVPPVVDLRALREPAGAARGEPAGWDALARRIEAAAAPELARRRAAGSPVFDLVPLLARSLRPALVAAAAAVLVAVGLSRGALGTAGDADQGAVELVSGVQVAEALRVGESDGASDAAAWLAEGAAPSREALARAVGLGGGTAEGTP